MGLKIERKKNNRIILTAPNGVKDVRHDTIHNRVILKKEQEDEMKYFVANE